VEGSSVEGSSVGGSSRSETGKCMYMQGLCWNAVTKSPLSVQYMQGQVSACTCKDCAGTQCPISEGWSLAQAKRSAL